MQVPDRDEWFPLSGDLPQPVWPAIWAWLEQVAPGHDYDEAIEQITAHWLKRLATALGDGHLFCQTETHFFITTQDTSSLKAVAKLLDDARAYVLRTLGKAAGIRHVRKLIILRLRTTDAASSVLESVQTDSPLAARFFRPGAWPLIFCEARNPADERWRMVGQEIDHVLTYLPLPYWLLVAFAQSLQVDLLGGRFAVLTEEAHALHQQCWNARSIQDFWSGDTFFDNEWSSLSYSLAPVLLDIIRRELHPDVAKLQRFIQTASYEDGGEAAAQRFFGISLGEIAGVLLGEDTDWTPRPATWHREEGD
ncbi:MAG TPA: hypothetical protein VK961_17640 [Chthoniobacter sp.]|nr:hypothetical protein [Chthoniobacter sp.]